MTSSHRALALFSGGLDSILSVLWMQKLGFEVVPLFFRTPFFTEERPLQSAKANNLNLEVIDIAVEHLKMLKKPIYGFGKNFNPCIDCHGLMFHLAGQLMPKYGADFLISGEVLSQRPMSQRRDAMNSVAKLSGYRDLLIRPLCQQLLDDTLPIREGWVNKTDLLAFNGRSRKPQINLARELGVVEFPSPAGGCSLTDRNYAARLRDLIEHDQLELPHINLLRYGRHFRLNEKVKLIVGREEADNQSLLDQNAGYMIIMNETDPGPTGLINCTTQNRELLQLASGIMAYYYKKSPDPVELSYGPDFPLINTMVSNKTDITTIENYMIKAT